MIKLIILFLIPMNCFAGWFSTTELLTHNPINEHGYTFKDYCEKRSDPDLCEFSTVNPRYAKKEFGVWVLDQVRKDAWISLQSTKAADAKKNRDDRVDLEVKISGGTASILEIREYLKLKITLEKPAP